ncbi:MAG: hypothetical protein HOP11_11885 [Saprospiraceae bacterium]|nr:hypothetical protein [Saprospiraceae bacterium]
MKSIYLDNFIAGYELELLHSLIGVTLTNFDFEMVHCVQYNPNLNSFEVAWPGTITLVSHSSMEHIIDIEFGGQVSLDQIESERVNFKIKKSKTDYSKGRGIMFSWFKVKKVELFSNNIIDLLDDTTFDISIINFVKAQNCTELEYKYNGDELIVLSSTDNRRIMVQIFESMNGAVTLHFNEVHIDLILSNNYHTQSPTKKYVKRLELVK